MEDRASWSEFLRDVHRHPERFLGPRGLEHLTDAIKGTTRLVWELPAFEDVSRCEIQVSERQYHLRCYSGTVRAEIIERLRIERADVLTEALLDLQRGLFPETADWAFPFRRNLGGFDRPARALLAADRGALAIRVGSDLWCQVYRKGWPVCPPVRLENDDSGVGLLCAAALTHDYFPGLPFTLEAVEANVHPPGRARTRVVWANEPLIPECGCEPECILYPESLRRWIDQA